MQDEEKQKRPGRIILYCAGNANVGQMTQAVAFELARQGVGRLLCLAGVGARLKGFITSARQIEETMVLDGCETGCGKKILQDNGVAVTHYFVMTEHGMKKTYEMGLPPEEVARVFEAVKGSLPGAAKFFPMGGTVK